MIAEIKEGLPQARLSQSIETIMQLVRSINRYLEVKAPWKLAKDESKKVGLVVDFKDLPDDMEVIMSLNIAEEDLTIVNE